MLTVYFSSEYQLQLQLIPLFPEVFTSIENAMVTHKDGFRFQVLAHGLAFNAHKDMTTVCRFLRRAQAELHMLQLLSRNLDTQGIGLTQSNLRMHTQASSKDIDFCLKKGQTEVLVKGTTLGRTVRYRITLKGIATLNRLPEHIRAALI